MIFIVFGVFFNIPSIFGVKEYRMLHRIGIEINYCLLFMIVIDLNRIVE